MPIDQQVLHAYFAPSEAMSDVEALRYRAAVTRERPSLAQRAGRAYALIEPFILTKPKPRPPVTMTPQLRRKRGEKPVIVVGCVLRPKPDLEKLTKVAWALAKRDIEKQLEDEAND